MTDRESVTKLVATKRLDTRASVGLLYIFRSQSMKYSKSIVDQRDVAVFLAPLCTLSLFGIN